MIRLFEEHKVRSVKEISGLWEFSKENEDKVYKLPVPGVWEQHPDLNTFRGIGTYKKEIFIEKNSDIRLVFKGVSHTGKVYFDDKYLGQHYNAFTPFDFIVKNIDKGNHELKVVVDNTFGEHSALHTPNDYYTYGGLTRPVSIECISKTFIKNTKFTSTYNKKSKRWNCKMNIIVASNNGSNDNKIVCKIANEVIETEIFNINKNEKKEFVLTKEFDNIKPWTNNDPNLYFFETCLMENEIVVDDLIDRVGFREIQVEGNDILVNGEKVFLKGFNRHEDHVVDGCAISLQNMVLDIDLMEGMNVNAVRTCHYPNDERFLDLCDEKGIYVWEENHARGFGLDRMENKNFDKQCEDCIEEMVYSHFNHASIIIWGLLNECASETEVGRSKYKKQFEQINKLDHTRPNTTATCRHFKDICLDLPDIVSFNIYTGWYQDLSIIDRHNEEMDWINKSGGKNKPVIVSEVGAGAIYGFRDRRRLKCSEERQSDIIADNLEVINNDERISGVFLWQFADCRVTEEEWFDKRPRTHNNKGVVDEYRRPKIAYDTVKHWFDKM